MHFYITVVVLLFFVFEFVDLTESTKEANDIELRATTKIPANDYNPTQDSWETNPSLKSLWIYRPSSIQSDQSDAQLSKHVVLKPPHLVTRLAKPLTFGFDPFFNKGYFEPFERRQKPVTLVTFRKNGIQTRRMADPSNDVSAEVAELQSSFNDISSLWHNLQEA